MVDRSNIRSTLEKHVLKIVSDPGSILRVSLAPTFHQHSTKHAGLIMVFI